MSLVEELQERYRSEAGEYPDPDGLAAAIRALAAAAGSSKHWHVDQLRAIAAELEGADG